jgi:hypothetical protein
MVAAHQFASAEHGIPFLDKLEQAVKPNLI